MASEISSHIRGLREFHRLSQVHFASKIKVNYRHYQNIEAGRVNISYDTLQKIAEHFGLTVADICVGHFCAENPIADAVRRDCENFDFAELKQYENRWRLRLPTVALDRDGLVRYANDKFVTLTGFDKFDVINKPIETILPDEAERKALHAYLGDQGRSELPRRAFFSWARKKDDGRVLMKLHYEPLKKREAFVGHLMVLCPIKPARVFE